jgi:phosphoenolpyruvate---glycerone phosphotransferase subunit DhaL
MESFNLKNGAVITDNLITVIQANKQYLSDIDGLIGDGDHGINMSKGFTITRDELDKTPGDLAHGLNTLSRVLMMKIGGSMGPLYGKFFKAIAKGVEGKSSIGKEDFGVILKEIEFSIATISPAKIGDKTLIDTLVPAVLAYNDAIALGSDFKTALINMKEAAREGMESTKEMVAKLGRASRLGERSRGVLDAGSVSCFLILESIADSIIEIIKE